MNLFASSIDNDRLRGLLDESTRSKVRNGDILSGIDLWNLQATTTNQIVEEGGRQCAHHAGRNHELAGSQQGRHAIAIGVTSWNETTPRHARGTATRGHDVSIDCLISW